MSSGIHTGYWHDYSKGSVLGATLTYSTNWGSQLISAASIVVQLTGAALWVLVSRQVHRYLSQDETHDELDAQRRVVIRNSGSIDAATQLWRMGYVWRGHASRSWVRTISVSILPFVIFTGFLVAGIFVGQIAEKPQDSLSLLKSGNCGLLYAHVANQVLSNITVVSTSYARDCYAQDQSGAVSCTRFAKAKLDYTSETNAPCPIGAGNCAISDNSAMRLTATNLDSHSDLGINAHPKDRIESGYQLTCAPVDHDLLYSFVNRSDEYQIRSTKGSYDLLQVTLGSYMGAPPHSFYNYSTIVETIGTNAFHYDTHTWHSAWPHDGSSDNTTIFEPFASAVGDVTVVVIAANGIEYLGTSSDPIFSTRNTLTALNGAYRSSSPFEAIVCSELYQVCNPKTTKCTDWFPLARVATLQDQIRMADNLGYNTAQNATYQRILSTIALDEIELIMYLPNALKASDLLVFGEGYSTQVPNNQWQQEVEYWFQSAMAKLQVTTQLYVDTPKSFVDADQSLFVKGSIGPEFEAQCSQQRVLTPAGYSSYNVFALVFIFCMAILFITLAGIQEIMHVELPGRCSGEKKDEKISTRQADGLLHLHRAALEAKGIDGWKLRRSGSDIPFVDRAVKRVPTRSLTYKADFQTDELVQ